MRLPITFHINFYTFMTCSYIARLTNEILLRFSLFFFLFLQICIKNKIIKFKKIKNKSEERKEQYEKNLK
jgi:hypothetical protein